MNNKINIIVLPTILVWKSGCSHIQNCIQGVRKVPEHLDILYVGRNAISLLYNHQLYYNINLCFVWGRKYFSPFWKRSQDENIINPYLLTHHWNGQLTRKIMTLIKDIPGQNSSRSKLSSCLNLTESTILDWLDVQTCWLHHCSCLPSCLKQVDSKNRK